MGHLVFLAPKENINQSTFYALQHSNNTTDVFVANVNKWKGNLDSNFTKVIELLYIMDNSWNRKSLQMHLRRLLLPLETV